MSRACSSSWHPLRSAPRERSRRHRPLLDPPVPGVGNASFYKPLETPFFNIMQNSKSRIKSVNIDCVTPMHQGWPTGPSWFIALLLGYNVLVVHSSVLGCCGTFYQVLRTIHDSNQIPWNVFDQSQGYPREFHIAC